MLWNRGVQYAKSYNTLKLKILYHIFNNYEYNKELQETVAYTIFAVLDESLDTGKSFTKAEIKSFDAIKKLVEKYNGIICEDLNDVANTINAIA